jgi:hypothetical protein
MIQLEPTFFYYSSEHILREYTTKVQIKWIRENHNLDHVYKSDLLLLHVCGK